MREYPKPNYKIKIKVLMKEALMYRNNDLYKISLTHSA